MFKNFICTIIAVLPVVLLQAQAVNAGSITGLYLSADKDGKIEIYKEANGSFTGKLVWLAKPLDDKGSPVTDANNPDEKLKGRPVLNITVLTGLVFNNGAWGGGKIYDPKTGKTYKVTIKIKGNTLELRCYTGIAMFGKTIIWQRVG